MAGRESRADVSRASRERLRDVLRDRLDEVQVRLEEATLRADAHLLTGNPAGAAEALADQRRLLADLEQRLDGVVAEALVEREAESVVADAAARLDPVPEASGPGAADSPDRAGSRSMVGDPASAEDPAPAGSGPEGDAPRTRVPVGASGPLPSMLGAVMTIVAAAVLVLGSWSGLGRNVTAGLETVDDSPGAVAAEAADASDLAASDPLAAAAGLHSTDQPWDAAFRTLPTSPSADVAVDDAGGGLALPTSSALGPVRPLGVRELVDGLLATAEPFDAGEDEGVIDTAPTEETARDAVEAVTEATGDRSDQSDDTVTEGTTDGSRKILEEAGESLEGGSSPGSPLSGADEQGDSSTEGEFVPDDSVSVDDGL